MAAFKNIEKAGKHGVKIRGDDSADEGRWRSEAMIARFVAEEMEEDKFRRGKGVMEIEALRERNKIPEHIRKLLLVNAFCRNFGTTEFAPGHTLRMRHSCVLIEGHCAK